MQAQQISVVLALVLSAPASYAEDTVLYCSEDHIVGLQFEANEWSPTYGDEEFGRRYAIRFNPQMTELSGVQGGDTVYKCTRNFPNKAPDVVTCVNSLVATMVFNYSTESQRFLISMVSPGGWLGEDATRTEGAELFTDHLRMGNCQTF
ncbi:hypothetical protein [Shimia sp.]|uniref:hypothetical protein n=1 Tax=Shimia sp. TaxID=1954381 RepID=UPI003B8D840F